MDHRALVLLVLGLLTPAPVSAAWADDGDDQYHFVAGLVDKGLHELAVEESRKFLRDYPRHARAELCRYRLATSLFELGRTAEASSEYGALVDRNGFEFQAECRFRLGQCMLEADRPDVAATMLALVLADGPEYLRLPATFLLGESEFQRERWAAADGHYAAALSADPDSEYASHALYGRAWCAFRLGDQAAVEQRVARFLERWPRDEAVGELEFLLGEARLADDRPREALDAFGRVPAGPHRDAALRGTGFALSALGEDAAAADAFGRLVSEYPESRFAAEAALQRGVHLLRAGDGAGAARALAERSVQSGPEADFWRGEAARAAGDDERALAHYERALGAAPETELEARIQAGRGDALTALGRTDEAAAAYRDANSDYALHAAAIAHVNAGRTDEAVLAARELLERYPESPYAEKARLALAEGLFAAEDWDAAERAFAEVQRDATDTATRSRALSRLAWCRFYAEDFASAAEAFGRVASDFQTGAEAEEARYMRGRALLGAGQSDAALAAWSEYLARHPRGAWYGRVHWELSQVDIAGAARDPNAKIEHLRAVLESRPEDELRASATFALAEELSTQEQVAEASSTYTAYLERWPDGERAAAARYGLGWIHFQSERMDDAAAVLAELGADAEADPELRAAALELSVWIAHGTGDAEAALRAWQGYAQLARDPTRRAQGARTTAQTMRAAGRLEDAQQILDAELQVAPGPEAALLLVEGTYLALERDNDGEAAERLRLARNLAPDSPAVAEAAFFVAEARFDAGDFEGAAALYREARAVPDSPVAAPALYKEGFALLSAERAAEAALVFAQLAADHPDDPLVGEALFLAGESYVRAGRFADAVPPLERHLKQHRRHEARPKALFRLGIAQGELGQWKDAERALAELARDYSEFEHRAEAELWRGRALAARGAAREARGAYERVLILDRGVLAARARLGLGDLARAAGDQEAALAEYLKVAVLFAADEEVATALLQAGQCLEALGDPERAAEQYREILKEHPKATAAAEARVALVRLGEETSTPPKRN